jgi:hypothetical protein
VLYRSLQAGAALMLVAAIPASDGNDSIVLTHSNALLPPQQLLLPLPLHPLLPTIADHRSIINICLWLASVMLSPVSVLLRTTSD